MNIVVIGTLALALALALAYLPLTSASVSTRRSVIKTLPLGILTLTGLASGAPLLLCAGLAFSALGDLFLSREGGRAFLAGLVSFALAHVFYLILFLGQIEALFWPGLVVLGLFALSTEFWLSPHTRKMRGPVRVYVLLISAMTVLALSLPAELSLARLGAMLFLASDLVLSLQLFRMDAGTRVARFAGYMLWCLYVAGQMAIFLAFLPGCAAPWGLS